uniref:Uncharacterized protein n=1 Tax=Lactuca sativa TaxID=4236 RepID=A0A9R1XUC8_LACSA|nr:hypothetical protein LSAT_V11C200056950 [Lactuca sativa]
MDWPLTCYPCVYGYAAISSLNRDAKDYVLVGRLALKRKWDQTEREEKETSNTVSKGGMVLRYNIFRERRHNRSTCPQRSNDVASTSGLKKKHEKHVKVDIEVNLEDDLEPIVKFDSESESDFETKSEPEPAEVQHDIRVEVQVQDDVEQEIQVPEVQANTEVEANIAGEEEIQHDTEGKVEVEDYIPGVPALQVRKMTQKTSK